MKKGIRAESVDPLMTRNGLARASGRNCKKMGASSVKKLLKRSSFMAATIMAGVALLSWVGISLLGFELFKAVVITGILLLAVFGLLTAALSDI